MASDCCIVWLRTCSQTVRTERSAEGAKSKCHATGGPVFRLREASLRSTRTGHVLRRGSSAPGKFCARKVLQRPDFLEYAAEIESEHLLGDARAVAVLQQRARDVFEFAWRVDVRKVRRTVFARRAE